MKFIVAPEGEDAGSPDVCGRRGILAHLFARRPVAWRSCSNAKRRIPMKRVCRKRSEKGMKAAGKSPIEDRVQSPQIEPIKITDGVFMPFSRFALQNRTWAL
jgi:hypothetical protein